LVITNHDLIHKQLQVCLSEAGVGVAERVA
jgi:hypothetical protein